MTPLPVTSARSKWVHLYTAGRSTACGRTVDIDQWTVRTRRFVPDDQWCGQCWNKALS